jgi:hypothetical protein
MSATVGDRSSSAISSISYLLDDRQSLALNALLWAIRVFFPSRNVIVQFSSRGYDRWNFQNSRCRGEFKPFYHFTSVHLYLEPNAFFTLISTRSLSSPLLRFYSFSRERLKFVSFQQVLPAGLAPSHVKRKARMTICCHHRCVEVSPYKRPCPHTEIIKGRPSSPEIQREQRLGGGEWTFSFLCWVHRDGSLADIVTSTYMAPRRRVLCS